MIRYFTLLCCLGLTAFAEAPPERLQCAAVYGLIAAGDPAPRTDSAKAARELLTANSDAAMIKAQDDAAAANQASGQLNPDEMAGTCDRAYNFKVAEASPLPYQPAKSTTLSDILRAPRAAAVQPPATSQQASGAGFLYVSCNGNKRWFDPGLSHDDLVRAAVAQGCTENDVNAMLTAQDMLNDH